MTIIQRFRRDLEDNRNKETGRCDTREPIKIFVKLVIDGTVEYQEKDTESLFPSLSTGSTPEIMPHF
jgi:hypothetical protein